MTHYDVTSIVEMSQLEHLRKNSGMYVGDSETATRLLEELLDNALDEVQAGHANIVGVFIDTKSGTFKVLDNGRGFPFDQSLPLEKDPPILSATKLFTSGKYKKGEEESAYKIAVGLHGIGLMCCFALSEYMNIDIYRNDLHAIYRFNSNGDVVREQKKHNDKKPFSTKIEVKPDEKYFTSTSVDLKAIEERLNIAVSNYPNLRAVLKVDNKDTIIKGSEDDLIQKYMGCSDLTWCRFVGEKKPETYDVRFSWDFEGSSGNKSFTVINLCKVEDGVHINQVQNIVKNYFYEQGLSKKLTFQQNDVLVGFRLYINLRLIETAFAEQTKHRLSGRTNLSVMNDLKDKIEKYFNKNKEITEKLLAQFQAYRTRITNKKLVKNNTKTRGFTTLTKLRDCIFPGGELLIGEGDSAGNGLIKVRDPKKHAILPLRGVIPNVLTKKDYHNNKELKDIIVACGCGVEKYCDVSKLRYDKIILAADADPAGHWITALLITLFAHKMAPVVQAGKLYVCKTPLFGYRDTNKKLVPLWDEKELKKARDADKKILRFKGLGEFDAKDLKTFVLDESVRKLIQVEWSEKNHDKLFELMSSSAERRKLVQDEWTL